MSNGMEMKRRGLSVDKVQENLLLTNATVIIRMWLVNLELLVDPALLYNSWITLIYKVGLGMYVSFYAFVFQFQSADARSRHVWH